MNYHCTPDKPVDCYRKGHKWHMLISRREVRNKEDIDVFNIEWEIRNGFLKSTGYWETHVTHPTERLQINVIFPESRRPKHVGLIESNRQRSHALSVGAESVTAGRSVPDQVENASTPAVRESHLSVRMVMKSSMVWFSLKLPPLLSPRTRQFVQTDTQRVPL